MPITISSLRLGGLDEALAEEVGLHDVLTVTIDDEAVSSLTQAAGSATGQGDTLTASEPTGPSGTAVVSARVVGPRVPAPPPPPLATSSLVSSVPEPGATAGAQSCEQNVVIDLTAPPMGVDQQVEAVLMKVADQEEGGVQLGVGSSGLTPMPAVTGLGALAWQLSMMQPVSSSSCQGSGLLQPRGPGGCASVRDHDVVSAITTAGSGILKTRRTTDVTFKRDGSAASSGAARARLAIRKTPPS